MHLRIVLGHSPPLSSRPDHEGVHRTLDAIAAVVVAVVGGVGWCPICGSVLIVVALVLLLLLLLMVMFAGFRRALRPLAILGGVVIAALLRYCLTRRCFVDAVGKAALSLSL